MCGLNTRTDLGTGRKPRVDAETRKKQILKALAVTPLTLPSISIYKRPPSIVGGGLGKLPGSLRVRCCGGSHH